MLVLIKLVSDESRLVELRAKYIFARGLFTECKNSASVFHAKPYIDGRSGFTLKSCFYGSYPILPNPYSLRNEKIIKKIILRCIIALFLISHAKRFIKILIVHFSIYIVIYTHKRTGSSCLS